MNEELEELSEEEKEKKKRREMLMKIFASGSKILKNVSKVAAVPLKTLSTIFESDKFISAFLESSGLKKKPDYQKQIAETTSKIFKELERRV